jgi:predicted amidophosphoribosyltransferase
MIADILFPSFCALCGRHVPARLGGICRFCSSQLPGERSGCPICGPFTGERCRCAERRFFFSASFAITEYVSPVPGLVAAFKSGRMPELARFFAAAAPPAGCVDCVTWIPSTARAFRRRGFEPARMLAQAYSRHMRLPCIRLLSHRGRGVQKECRYDSRFIGTLGSFDPEGEIAGKRILLIDDVFTTGATVNEASRVLKSAGAADVSVLVLARVGGEE